MLKRRLQNPRGFTLLELLVVVAILAAIAGTATIALQDTDARAAAAAHVAMMDELNKGIRTYRVLQKNTLPSRFDALLTTDGKDPGMLGFTPHTDAALGDVVIADIPTGVQDVMRGLGIDALMYIDESGQPENFVAGSEDCTVDNIQALIRSRKNAVVAGNIFMTPEANGCGVEVDLDGTAALPGVFWTGGTERLTGLTDVHGSDADHEYNEEGHHAFLLTGIGPSSSLFDGSVLGAMTTVPIYRHVAADEYPRFIAVWDVGTYDGDGNIIPNDQCVLVTIVDGALDTKEEELGEWDGTRNTI